MTLETHRSLNPSLSMKITAGLALFFAVDGAIGNLIIGDRTLRTSVIAACIFAEPPLMAAVLTAIVQRKAVWQNTVNDYAYALCLNVLLVAVTAYVFQLFNPNLLYGLGTATGAVHLVPIFLKLARGYLD